MNATFGSNVSIVKKTSRLPKDEIEGSDAFSYLQRDEKKIIILSADKRNMIVTRENLFIKKNLNQ